MWHFSCNESFPSISGSDCTAFFLSPTWMAWNAVFLLGL